MNNYPFLDSYTIDQIRSATIGVTCNNACQGKGALFNGNSFKDCICVKEFLKQIAFTGADISKKYWTFDFSDLTPEFQKENEIALRIIRTYSRGIKKAIDEGIGLFIQGQAGLAKSSIGHLILREAVLAGFTGYSIRMTKLSRLIFDSLDSPEKKQQLDWIREKVQILMIDEIEKDYKAGDLSSFQGTQVNDFFSEIYDRQVPLILTSNLAKKDLVGKQASNIIDRFKELIDVIFVGESYRNQNDSLEKLVEEDI